MANVDRVNEILYAYNDAGLIDDEELLLLADRNVRRNPYFPYWHYARFDLEQMDDDECKAEFRFRKEDVFTLLDALHLPPEIRVYNGVVFDSVEALCILLRRLSYPCRYGDLIPRFGRPVPQLSMISNKLVGMLHTRFGYLLRNLDQPWLSRANLKAYADAIHQTGAALDNCWGFIDGTVRPICRPKQNQRAVYNGHKRVHAIKFQSVVAPNGLIANLFGPVEGRRHDSALLAMSGLLPQLAEYSFSPEGQALCLYGDPAYPHRVHLQRPFPRRPYLTPEEHAFNQSMSRVRVSVEWIFGDIINSFKFMDFKKNQKIGLSPVGQFYIASALLRNANTCLYGSSTSEYFNLQPPALGDYFI